MKRAIKDLGLKGLKLHPGMQGFCILHPDVVKVINAAGELGVSIIIHEELILSGNAKKLLKL